jgi:ketosteroid isomerase-like protein
VSGDDPTRDALWSLSLGYARSVDRGDIDAFLAVFAPDAELSIHNPPDAEATSVYRGQGDLARIPPRMARFRATFHLLGQAEYQLSGAEPTGEVYCVAHHRSAGDDDPSDYVMLIRYRDRYRCHEGQWRIAERRVLVDWTETRPANPPGR